MEILPHTMVSVESTLFPRYCVFLRADKSELR